MKNISNATLVPAHTFKIIDLQSEVLISKKQKFEMIYFNGSTFKRVSENKACGFRNIDNSIKQVYICSREGKGCRCTFLLLHDGNGKIINSHTISLEHSVDLYRSERYEFKCHVNMCLANCKNETPFNIINSYLKHFDITEYSPCLNYITSTITREKQKGLGTLPQSFTELDLNKLKEVGGDFEIEHLQYQDNSNTKNVLLIYNHWQLEMSTKSTFFLCDSTFKNVPRIFSQLLVVHIVIGPQSFPLFFALCQSKSEEMYTTVFRRIKELGVEIKTCMLDYEVSQRNSIRNVFGEGGVYIRHCIFHWYQSIIKHVKKESLGSLYSNDKEINSLIHLYFALPFVPISDMNLFMEIIQNCIQEVKDCDIKTRCLKFNEYFHTTWINGVHFKPKDWSQHGDLEVLTNNWSEGFNSGFARRFARSHPNVFLLIETLQNVMKYYQFLHNDLQIHRDKYKFTNYSDFAREIKVIQSERETVYKDNPKKYLIALGNVQMRLLIKQQIEFYEENKINKMEIKRLKEMLKGDRDLSIIVNESDDIELKIKHKKLSIVTKHLNKKRQQYLKEMTSKGIRIKRRKAVDMVLNESERMQITSELNEVTAESVKNDELSKYQEDIQKGMMENEEVLNEFDDIDYVSMSEIKKAKSSELSMINNITNIEPNENQDSSSIVVMNEEIQEETNTNSQEEECKSTKQINNGYEGNETNNAMIIEEIEEQTKNGTKKRIINEKRKVQNEKKPKKKNNKKTHLMRMNANTKRELRRNNRKEQTMSEESSE